MYAVMEYLTGEPVKNADGSLREFGTAEEAEAWAIGSDVLFWFVVPVSLLVESHSFHLEMVR